MAGDRDTASDAVDLPLVETELVSRSFGPRQAHRWAVSEVTCAVLPGTLVALTGPSGSGKSTLLFLLAGLDTPTAGFVRWPGLGGPPAGRPGLVGLVFQGPSLVSALDVLENVALPLVLSGAAEDEAAERARAALALVELEGLASSLPDEISSGQAQRVAVARILASRPRLILADEPTGRLDRRTGDTVVSVLLDTAREIGAALVVATHDPAVAGRLTERWQMRDGHLTVGEVAS